jgi:hypothetical protein
MHDTLTLMRLGITGKLATTLCWTNPWPAVLSGAVGSTALQ